jgi:hypothetical protein
VTAYIARLSPADDIRIYRVDHDVDALVVTIPLPAGSNLRSTLLDAGWQPTGRRARGGWGAIFVTPAEDRPHPTPPHHREEDG